jgi:2-haloacid dehalogenase
MTLPPISHNTITNHLPPQSYEQWGEIAQEWRNSYLKFTRAIAADPRLTYKTVDQHHLDSLHEILTSHGLADLFSQDKITSLSLVWHYLDPWPDTNAGLAMLNKKFQTATLSNGNVSLLTDMVSHGSMPFTHIFSAEMFQSYKPSPKVYLGAAEKLGLKPEECMMVAAHLDDLKYAKSNGMRTLYVERKREERFPELKGEGFVDVWVSVEEEGFVAVAEKLGIEK